MSKEKPRPERQFTYRMADGEQADIVAAAKARGMTVNAYIRDVMPEHARRTLMRFRGRT